MSRMIRILFPMLLVASSVSAAFDMRIPAGIAPASDYTLEVLVDGVAIPQYTSRGSVYVEASPGREYSIRLSNRTPGRVAVALSVDGLNSIDARTTTARDGSKWILGPYQTITLEGWQTSTQTARRFFFTTEARSYGAWLGQTRNLGIITAAVFRESRPRPAPIWNPGGGEKQEENGSRLKDSGSPRSDSALKGQAAAEPAPSDDLAATGIGQEVGHQVARVAFNAEEAPAAVLNVRYEYHDALLRLGVLPRPMPCLEDPLARGERARGFGDTGFAPDPYRQRH